MRAGSGKWRHFLRTSAIVIRTKGSCSLKRFSICLALAHDAESFARSYIPLAWWIRGRHLLRSLSLREAMVVGNLLAHWRRIQLDHRSAAAGLQHVEQLHRRFA